MVKVTEKSVCRGVAGQRSGSVKGIVIHNTWDNLPASYHLNRLAKANNSELAKGFAHYYIDENEIIRVEDTYNGAWHVANYEGNMYYLGYEVKGNRSTPSHILKQAEQNAFWQAAIDLKFYKLPVNRNTVMLHHQFSATECPKRSLIEHCGYDSTYAVPLAVTNKLKDYYIKEIKKYYDNPKLQPNQTVATPKPNPITQGIPKAKGGLWYRSHLSNVGWLGFVGTEETSGTTGKAIPIEAIDVRWDNQTDKISASFQDIKGKWHEWEYGDTGTTGKALALSVVRFDLGLDVRNTGRTLQYRVHSADVGWSDWKNQGEVAGTSGKQIEAIQMRMLKNGKVEKG